MANNGSCRRCDFVANDQKNEAGFIIDPTIIFQKFQNQPQEVDDQNKAIYDATKEGLTDKYGI